MTEWADWGALRLAALVRDGGATAAEVAAYFQQRAHQWERLNALVQMEESPTPPPATAAANPLSGAPIIHKDIFCARGQISSCASRILGNYRPPFDAAVIERARAAGLVSIGRANMDEFAMGSSGEHSAFGVTRNPWDETRTPGGSSSGSAAAVAARLTPLATGTDTGGSIRQPAAFCGVTGIKPTYGRISRWGMVAFASGFDQAGVMAPAAEDCAAALNALCGFDERDSTSLQVPTEDFTRLLGEPLAGLTIGAPKEFFGDGLESETGGRTQEALRTLAKAGAKIVEVSLPTMAFAIPAYYVLTSAEASSNLSRFDGVRYGLRIDDGEGLTAMYEKTRAAGFGEEVKRRILVGTFVLSHGYYDAYYRRAAKVRKLIADDFARAFEQCDIIAGPTTPGPAFKLNAIADSDPVAMYMQDIYTVPVNLAGLPAASVPCGFVGGMPVGLQLIAPPLAEARLLQTAHQYQQHVDFHRRRPPEAA